jgi:hypothetical protein
MTEFGEKNYVQRKMWESFRSSICNCNVGGLGYTGERAEVRSQRKTGALHICGELEYSSGAMGRHGKKFHG